MNFDPSAGSDLLYNKVAFILGFEQDRFKGCNTSIPYAVFEPSLTNQQPLTQTATAEDLPLSLDPA